MPIFLADGFMLCFLGPIVIWLVLRDNITVLGLSRENFMIPRQQREKRRTETGDNPEKCAPKTPPLPSNKPMSHEPIKGLIY